MYLNLVQLNECIIFGLACNRLGFKTCLSMTKTETQQFQDQDQDRDSRLTRPILEVHDWDGL